jgi:hypothetical protein
MDRHFSLEPIDHVILPSYRARFGYPTWEATFPNENHGRLNGCAGKGACKTAANDCKGKNACKGKGWIEMLNTECADQGGTFEKS